MKKIIIILVLLLFILPSFGFSRFASASHINQLSQNENISPPNDLGQAKETGVKSAKFVWQELPKAMQKVWTEQVVPFYQKAWKTIKSPWEDRLKPWLEETWGKIMAFLGYEIKSREPIIKEELKKEEKEMKQDAPKLSKSIWQKIQEIIK